LLIISGCYDLSNILPDGFDTAKALRILNSANAKNNSLSGLDSRPGSEGGVYRMTFKVYNPDKVRKGRFFYYMCSDKANSPPLALTSAGAQLVFDRVVRKSSRKRARLDEDDEAEDENNNARASTSTAADKSPTIDTSSNLLPSTSESQYDYTYWNNTNVAKLFAPKEGEQTILSVHRMVDQCQSNAENASSDSAIKYLLLRKAYQFALGNMNKIRWRECCGKALSMFQNYGFKTILNTQTIMKWNRHFRTFGTLMPSRSKETKEFEPKLFAVFPEAKTNINLCFFKNLEKINVDGFRSYVLDEIFPKILADANSSLDAIVAPLDMVALLSSINLKSLGLATSYKYLRYLGYKFDKNPTITTDMSALSRLIIAVGLLSIISEMSCCVMSGYR
jgi:hypothetical protein